MSTEQGDISSLVDLNDSDILRLEKVVRLLNDRVGSRLPLEAFRKEIVERFGEAGFKVDVKVWTTGREGLYAFDIEIQERLEGQFDPEKMMHEVQHDLLGLGTGGVIGADGTLSAPKTSTHIHRA